MRLLEYFMISKKNVPMKMSLLESEGQSLLQHINAMVKYGGRGSQRSHCNIAHISFRTYDGNGFVEAQMEQARKVVEHDAGQGKNRKMRAKMTWFRRRGFFLIAGGSHRAKLCVDKLA
jgi:hypothetical protein